MKKILSLMLFCALLLCLCSSFGAVSVNQVFTYADPDWGKGNAVTADGLWKYEWFARETETFAEMDWSADGAYYEAQYETAAASDTHWYCRIRSGGSNLHPGAQADAVRTFICPESGTVQFSVNLQRQSEPNPNGNTVRVMRNDDVIPIDGEIDVYLDDTEVLSVDLEIEVQKGDLLRLLIGSQGNSGSDWVNVSGQKIKYLSGANLEAEKPVVTVTCVGDSITEGMGTSGGLKGANAYPFVLEGLLDKTGVADFAVNNCGKSGTTALKNGDRPYKDTAEYHTSLQSSPDIVIICLGANDSKSANWNADLYRSDYYSLISEYVNLPSKPEVYLFYTTYVADQSKTGCRRTVIQDEILPIQDELAEELGLKIIDLNTLTKKNATKYADGVHPNDELQGMMAEYIFNALCSEGVGGLSSKNATADVKMIGFEKTDASSDGTVSTEGDSGISDSSDGPDSGTVIDSSSGADSAPASDDIKGADSGSSESDGSETDNGWILWVCIIGVVVLAAGGAVWYFCFFKKK